MTEKKRRTELAIVGGGAAGLMSALHAARNGCTDIVLMERHPRVGKKLLATGNGRCNLTNIYTGITNYHGARPDFCVPALSSFPPQAVMEMFHGMGVYCKVEDEGKVYPYSDQASSVLDCLRMACAETGCIQELCDFPATSIVSGKDCFQIAGEARYLTARRVIVTTGGKAAPHLCSDGSGYPLMTALGHHTTELYPSLVQLRTENSVTRGLKGIKFSGEALLLAGDRVVQAAVGEILFTEYGLSGPPIFALSRLAGECYLREKESKETEISLRLFPGKSEQELYALLTERKEHRPSVLLENYFTGMLHKRIGQEILKGLGYAPLTRPAEALRAFDWGRIAGRLNDWRFKVLGGHSFKNAQVTAGGIDTGEVHENTMESKLCKGLYLAGELLDIDGDCGGFNLQWAWSSGALAGRSAARSLHR